MSETRMSLLAGVRVPAAAKQADKVDVEAIEATWRSQLAKEVVLREKAEAELQEARQQLLEMSGRIAAAAEAEGKVARLQGEIEAAKSREAGLAAELASARRAAEDDVRDDEKLAAGLTAQAEQFTALRETVEKSLAKPAPAQEGGLLKTLSQKVDQALAVKKPNAGELEVEVVRDGAGQILKFNIKPKK